MASEKADLSRFFPRSGGLSKDRKAEIARHFRAKQMSPKDAKQSTARGLPGRIRAITFDLDDTVWDGYKTIVRANDKMFEWLQANAPRCAAKYTPGRFRELMGSVKKREPEIAYDFTALRKRALDIALKDTGYQDAPSVEEAFGAFIAARNDVYLYDDALETLRSLRATGVIVGAITNGNADVWAIPRLAGLFDFSVRAGDAGEAKPRRAPFDRALECCRRVLAEAGVGARPGGGESGGLLGVEHILHVGDSLESDVGGAKRAGFASAWLNRPGAGEAGEAGSRSGSKKPGPGSGLESESDSKESKGSKSKQGGPPNPSACAPSGSPARSSQGTECEKGAAARPAPSSAAATKCGSAPAQPPVSKLGPDWIIAGLDELCSKL